MSINELDIRVEQLLHDLDDCARNEDADDYGLPLYREGSHKILKNLVCQFLIDLEEFNVPTKLW